MSVKGVLDDAAAQATAGLRIDLQGAHRQADERHALVRRRRHAALGSGLAVAAVVLLLAVLLPGGVFRSFSQAPAVGNAGPTGLPERWYYAPPWTPPVTRQPMAAASMALAVPQSMGGTATAVAPVLVSADGKEYASVPWGKGDSMFALAPSGRYVGWVTTPSKALKGPEHVVLHRIHLVDGRQTDIRLAAGVQVGQLHWERDQLIVGVQFLPGQVLPGFVLSAESDALRQISEPSTATDPKAWNPVADVNESDLIVSPSPIQGPDERWYAGVSGKPADRPSTTKATFWLDVGHDATVRRFPILGEAPIVAARVLGWADGGIVVRVHSDDPRGGRGISLRLFDPETGGSRIVSVKRATNFYPVAVAVDVVGAGSTVPGVAPEFDRTDRRHLQFLTAQAWFTYKLELLGGLLLGAVAVVGGLAVIRRRAPRFAEAQPDSAENVA